ncbi:hypothetical protein EMIT047CA2_50240 [Pseudomonas soli]
MTSASFSARRKPCAHRRALLFHFGTALPYRNRSIPLGGAPGKVCCIPSSHRIGRIIRAKR